MTFKCRFNATCFLFKINRFVLIFSKTSNRFVLKICSGGFADYIRKEPVNISSEDDKICVPTLENKVHFPKECHRHQKQ